PAALHALDRDRHPSPARCGRGYRVAAKMFLAVDVEEEIQELSRLEIQRPGRRGEDIGLRFPRLLPDRDAFEQDVSRLLHSGEGIHSANPCFSSRSIYQAMLRSTAVSQNCDNGPGW